MHTRGPTSKNEEQAQGADNEKVRWPLATQSFLRLKHMPRITVLEGAKGKQTSTLFLFFLLQTCRSRTMRRMATFPPFEASARSERATTVKSNEFQLLLKYDSGATSSATILITTCASRGNECRGARHRVSA